MRLLQLSKDGRLSLTKDLIESLPKYAILSHTWGADEDEVTFTDIQKGLGEDKSGYKKIVFCGEQARKDGISHFWVDTCCIDKSNHSELSEAIISMFRWYHDAVKCYVYLSDVSGSDTNSRDGAELAWKSQFRVSKWFTRGWTLQELLAPEIVEFYSQKHEILGTKKTLAPLIHEITSIPINALQDCSLSQYSTAEKLQWAAERKTKRPEDQAYCLLGILEVFMPLMYGEKENAFVRLQKALSEHLDDLSTNTANEYWLVPRSAQPLFTGREEVLQELGDAILGAIHQPRLAAQCRIVISGIGGQGKSEICLQLASRFRHIFWAVIWIDVSTTELAERSFLDAAQTLSIPAQKWLDARSGIANLKHRWLLILDNADSPDIDYLDYFPESPLGTVILTSRNKSCQQFATFQRDDLEGMGENDSVKLILRAADIPKAQYEQYQSDARNVANLLQSHALALIQAGAYIARGHCTLADYPEVYKRQRLRLSKFRPAQARSRYQDVYATFEVSIDKLKIMQSEAAIDALQLLPILAVYGPNQIPVSLFKSGWQGARQILLDPKDNDESTDLRSLTSWHLTKLPNFIDVNNKDWDDFRLMEGMSLLKALSLVSVDLRDDSSRVSFHPLVHAWARDRQTDSEKHQSWLQAGCLIALALGRYSISPVNQRHLQSHVEALIDWPIEAFLTEQQLRPVVSILHACSWLLQSMRANTKLHGLLHKIFQSLDLNPLKVDAAWTALYVLKARNYRCLSRLTESIALCEQIVETYQSKPEGDPDRLASQHRLAIVYRDNGQVQKAIVLLERVVGIQEQTLAEDHPKRLASQHELAIAYLEDGQYEKATVLLEKVVSIRNHALAEDHPGRLASQHMLAIIYQNNGQVQKAIVLLERVVDIQEQTLAEDHPDRLASQHELAIVYQDNGQVQKAIVLLERVVDIREQTLAEDHPNRLASQRSLAICLWRIGKHEEALVMMKHVVSIYKKAFDDSHPLRQNAEEWLAGFESHMAKLGVS